MSKHLKEWDAKMEQERKTYNNGVEFGIEMALQNMLYDIEIHHLDTVEQVKGAIHNRLEKSRGEES